MQSEKDFPAPHPNLSDEISHNIIQSEVDGGVFLRELPAGTLLEIETNNRVYEVEVVNGLEGTCLIFGHPKYCPKPVLVNIHGSTWDGSMLKIRFIGRGMFLEFLHPMHGVVRTSLISEVRRVHNPKAAS